MKYSLFIILVIIAILPVATGCGQSCKNKGSTKTRNLFCEKQIFESNCLLIDKINNACLIKEMDCYEPMKALNSTIELNYKTMCSGYTAIHGYACQPEEKKSSAFISSPSVVTYLFGIIMFCML